MSIRFTSPTHPDALIKMLNSLGIRYQKLGKSPFQISVFDGQEWPRRHEHIKHDLEHTLALLESIEPDTVIEIQANASSFLAETVVRSLPSGAILDIGRNLQLGPDPTVGRFSPICTALKDLPIGSRVLLRGSLRSMKNYNYSSIYAITSSFHGKLIGVFIDPDTKKPMNPDKIASINLSSDCFVYLNDVLSDKIIIALGMNKNIRNFDVTQLSGNNCKKLQQIIEGRDHIVELRCKTAEQRDVFHNKPGITILMPGAIQRNPLTKDRDAALALLDLQRQNEMEEPDDPQAQSVTTSRKSRLPSPDSIVDHIYEDAPSDSEHANNKRQRRMIVTPDQEESDATAKGRVTPDQQESNATSKADDDAVSDNTWCGDDASDDDEYTDDDSEPSPSPK